MASNLTEEIQIHNKEGILMYNYEIKKASNLMTLDGLKLKRKTMYYFSRHHRNPQELLLEARRMPYRWFNGYSTNKVNELSMAFDEAGYIRHDFDEVSFGAAKVLSELIDDEKFITRLEDFSSNLEYEKYQPLTECQREAFLETVSNALTPSELRVAIAYYGLSSEGEITLRDIRKRYNYSVEYLKKMLQRIRKKLQRVKVELSSICRFNEGDLIKHIEDLLDELKDLSNSHEVRRMRLIKAQLRVLAEAPYEAADYAAALITPIENVGFSPIVYHYLKRNSLHTVADVVGMTTDSYNNIAVTIPTMCEIAERLAALGLESPF